MISWHRTKEPELEACLAVNPRAMGSELVGYRAALDAWRAMLRCLSFLAFTIDASPAVQGQHVVGFGGGVFVQSAFVDDEIRDPAPGVMARLIAKVAAGHSPLLSDAELRRANTTGGLDILFLGGYIRTDILQPDDAEAAINQIWLACLQEYRGYFIRRAIREAVDAADVAYMHAYKTGIVISFEDFPRTHPGTSWNPDRALMISTREDGLTVPGSIPALIYEFRQPVLGLSSCDQQLLAAALRGLTDEELAAALGLKLSAVKKRWAAVFDRVSQMKADVLGGVSADPERATRGRQKRHLLLTYLREHPEEIRPRLRRRPGARVRAHR